MLLGNRGTRGVINFCFLKMKCQHHSRKPSMFLRYWKKAELKSPISTWWYWYIWPEQILTKELLKQWSSEGNEECSWRVIPCHSSAQPLPFPCIFCSPSTCTEHCLCTRVPDEMIVPRPQYYYIGFFSCHFIASVYPILPSFIFFYF